MNIKKYLANAPKGTLVKYINGDPVFSIWDYMEEQKTPKHVPLKTNPPKKKPSIMQKTIGYLSSFPFRK